MRNKCR